MTDFNQACPCCYAGGISEERERELLALLRRDWAVRVLDASEWHWKCEGDMCSLTHLGRATSTYIEATPDAARHAAARAVFPTLDAETREKLGECP